MDETVFEKIPDESVDNLLNKENDEAVLQGLEDAIEQLCEEDQALILLYYQQGKSITELSEILDLSPSNVKVRLHRTRKRLYVMLKPKDDEQR